jgi:hypothetical protein
MQPVRHLFGPSGVHAVRKEVSTMFGVILPSSAQARALAGLSLALILVSPPTHHPGK